MAVDWDAIQKASKQLEDNMKNAHNDINEMRFEGHSDDGLVQANMKGNFDLENFALSNEKIDSNIPAEKLAELVAEACCTATNDVVEKIRQYSKEKIAQLAGNFDASIGKDSSESESIN